MKLLLLFLTAGCYIVYPSGAADSRSQARVQASTILHGKSNVRSNTSTSVTNTTVRGTGVWVHFSPMSASAAKKPYDVQCFFLVKGGNGKSTIHRAFRQLSDDPYDAEFYSGGIVGASRTDIFLPVEISFDPTKLSVPGTLHVTKETKGVTSEGWVVRVLEAGEIVFVGGSLNELRDYARANQAIFDKAAGGVKPLGPPANKKPATAFGNTLLDRKPTR